jgi:hypothetical protein
MQIIWTILYKLSNGEKEVIRQFDVPATNGFGLN